MCWLGGGSNIYGNWFGAGVPQNLATIRYLTRQQFHEVLQCIQHEGRRLAPWLSLALRIYWATGCRPAEIVGRSERQRREPEEGFASQTGIKEHHGLRARDVLGDNFLFVEGKNTNGGRGRALALKPRTLLVADRELYRELEALAAKAADPDQHLFGLGPNHRAPNWDGYWQLQRQLRKLRRVLPPGLKGFEVRWLRHSWAIHALRQGVDLVNIQRQLGHARLENTAVYLRFFPTDVQGVIEKFTRGENTAGPGARDDAASLKHQMPTSRRGPIVPLHLTSATPLPANMAPATANPPHDEARNPVNRNGSGSQSLLEFGRQSPRSPLYGLSRARAARFVEAVTNAYAEGFLAAAA